MTATINGAPIHYVDLGPRNGLPVVFIHGFPFSHLMWEPQLEPVSRRHRAIAYDVRGHGESFVGDGQYTIEGHVDDLVGLLDHLDLPHVVVVGLSMGGYIALRALEREPRRFRAAVLCDTRSEPDGNDGKLRRFATITAVKTHGSAPFADTFVKAVFAPASLERIPERVAVIRGIIARTPALSIAGTLLALAARTDTTPSLGAIGVPTLILVGEEDLTTPPDASRSMHEKIRGSHLHIIPKAAHMSNLENPEAFNAHLLGFLDQVSPQKR
jgi:3-oxoadipate enol-lactonase